MYSIDYLQKLQELLVPDKRNTKITAFNTPSVNDLQNINDNLFFTYKEYQSLAVWASGTYSKNDKVLYKKAVYQSVKDENTDEPNYTTSWNLISPNFFGVDNLLKIRGEKLVLEYALNTWFDGLFRQPPYVSDIYLTLNTVVYQSPFKIGASENQSSKIATVGSVDFIGLDYTFIEQFGFTIMVTTSIFNALGSTNEIRNNIIRDFANKYVACGIFYKIQTY